MSGMNAYYDKMVPSIANSLVKKYGVNLDNSMLPMNDMVSLRSEPLSTQRIHSFDLTPQMKEDLLTKGIPLFAEGGQV